MPDAQEFFLTCCKDCIASLNVFILRGGGKKKINVLGCLILYFLQNAHSGQFVPIDFPERSDPTFYHRIKHTLVAHGLH